jgi:hypothetical protein
LPLSPLRPTLYCKPGGVLSLSGPDLQEFIKAVLIKGACFRFKARGFSMHPFIQDGDVITISPLGGRGPGLGRVVAFCHPETQRLVVHRVLAEVPGGYLVRGDGSPKGDGFIPVKNVFGTVSRVERQGMKVWVGMGPEGRLLAWLSRLNLLQPLVQRTTQIFSPALRRLPK